MDEMYRILGREHQADLEREAVRRRRAAEVRAERREPDDARTTAPRRRPARVVALLLRAVRVAPFL